jgi:hypothetical protein
MADYLHRGANQHARVDAVIEKVQQQWIDHPIRRVARPPQIPEFTPPATEVEARARLAMVRGDLVEVRMGFRAGETVKAAASNVLRMKWTMCWPTNSLSAEPLSCFHRTTISPGLLPKCAIRS